MPQLQVENLSRPLAAPLRVIYCATFTCRLRGLTFRRELAAESGLLLVQSRESRLDAAIHMLGVWFDLAVIWLDQDYQVVDLRLARRWRPIYVPGQPAKYILEAAAGRIGEFQPGDRLNFEQVDGESLE